MKKLMLLLLCVFTIKSHSQDSLKTIKSPKSKRSEIGLNILPPFLLLSGVSSANPKFFNATYRYLLNERNALRIVSGINVYNSNYTGNQNIAVSMGNGLTVYQISSSRTPLNVLSGIGYERILGKHKLKHVIGCDLTYNYVTTVVSSNYYGMKDTTYNNVRHAEYIPIDTGRAITSRYFHKIGITPFYSLRYELNSKWLVVASTRLNFQYYQVKNENYPKASLFDFNMDGLISEISLFYRF